MTLRATSPTVLFLAGSQQSQTAGRKERGLLFDQNTIAEYRAT